MRIAQVCPYSLSIPGGVQDQVLGLARALRALGHDTVVLGPSDDAPPDVGVVPLGRSIPFASNGSVAPIAPDPACLVRTRTALRDGDFDVLHLQEPLVPGPTLTSLVLKPAPLVGTFHRSGASSAYRLLSPVVRRLAGRLDTRLAVSPDARSTAEDALGGDYELVFNAVDVPRFAGADPWPVEAPTVLFVGRHEPRKGLAVLLEAMQDVPGDVRVWVAGDGPQTAELRDRYRDPRVEWLGRISDGEKASRLRAADVFCAPSLHGESFGIVLLEAMAAGTAIVASDLPGYRNVAPDVDHAVLVPPGDARALAMALVDTLADDSRRSALVATGRSRAASFSMEALAAVYVEHYQRVLEKKSSP